MRTTDFLALNMMNGAGKQGLKIKKRISHTLRCLKKKEKNLASTSKLAVSGYSGGE